MSSKEELLMVSVGKSQQLIKAVEVIKVIEDAFIEVITKWRTRVKELETRITALEKTITEATTKSDEKNAKIVDCFGDKGQGGESLVGVIDKFKKAEANGEE